MDSYIYALGFFDGVHAGHQALLNACKKLAASNHCLTGVITFASHPDALVLGNSPKLINTPEDRELLLYGFGMDRVVTLPFDRKMCSTHWSDFLDMLQQEYGAAGFVCGDDFRFGSKGLGTPTLLAGYCSSRQLPCSVVPEQVIRGTRVSSSHIRNLLEQGDMKQAVEFLGHPHLLSGTVVPGKQLGRTIGIPTANLRLPDHLAAPRFGVYACLAKVDGHAYPAVTNVGTRPTVEGAGITVEPWLLDFDGDLYNHHLVLEFYEFVRPERRFESLDALRQEVLRNARQTREYFQA